MKIIRIPVGIYAANCYIVFSDKNREGIIVDPGGNVDDLLSYIKENNIIIKSIILTHGHGDHIGGVSELKEELKVPVMIHSADSNMLVDGSKNLSSIMAMGTITVEPDKLLIDGDKIEFGGLHAKIIHTPGHTPGGICIMIEDNILTGDTLFAGSIGRTDLLGGDYNMIIKSIKEKLMNYSDNIKIHPGHGTPSTIGRERVSNPFIK